MESERISERVKAGMRRAREKGQKLGRPGTTTRQEREKIRQIFGERDMTYDALAERTGHPKTTVIKIIKEDD